MVYCFPQSVSVDAVRREFLRFARLAESDHIIRDVRLFEGSAFIGLDAATDLRRRQAAGLCLRIHAASM